MFYQYASSHVFTQCQYNFGSRPQKSQSHNYRISGPFLSTTYHPYLISAPCPRNILTLERPFHVKTSQSTESFFIARNILIIERPFHVHANPPYSLRPISPPDPLFIRLNRPSSHVRPTTRPPSPFLRPIPTRLYSPPPPIYIYRREIPLPGDPFSPHIAASNWVELIPPFKRLPK